MKTYDTKQRGYIRVFYSMDLLTKKIEPIFDDVEESLSSAQSSIWLEDGFIYFVEEERTFVSNGGNENEDNTSFDYPIWRGNDGYVYIIEGDKTYDIKQSLSRVSINDYSKETIAVFNTNDRVWQFVNGKAIVYNYRNNNIFSFDVVTKKQKIITYMKS